jgi:serine/threonine-protein kinase RsbT
VIPVPAALNADTEVPMVPIDLLDRSSRPGFGELSVTADDGVVAIGSAADVVTARDLGRALAARLGFSACDQMMIATAISELARNILEFATLGRIAITPTRTGTRLGLVIEARDQGPGIADPVGAVDGAHSSGFGLPGVRRLMDEFDIASEVGKGTTVMAKKWQFGEGGSVGSLHGATIAMEVADTLCPTVP